MENFHEDSSLYCSIEAAAPAVEGPLSWPFHHVLFTSSSYSGRCRSGLMLTVAAVRHRLFNNNVVLLQELGWVDSAISTPHAPRNATGLINPSGASALAWDFWSRPPLSVIPGMCPLSTRQREAACTPFNFLTLSRQQSSPAGWCRGKSLSVDRET